MPISSSSHAPSRRPSRRQARAPSFRFGLAALALIAGAAGSAAVYASGTRVTRTPSAPTTIRDVETEELIPTIGSLKGVLPLARNVDEYIVDKLAAQQLGKAMFWDIQVGSTGVACASCHFHGGADIRVKNHG